MDKKELKLIFVRNVGESLYGNDIYELVFSKNADSAIGSDWEKKLYNEVPIPENTFIDMVAILSTSKIRFILATDLIQETDYIRYLDVVYGQMALMFEHIEDYQTFLIDKRTEIIKFFYGDTMEFIEKKLLEYDIQLNLNY